MSAAWTLQRLRAMSPGEIAWRVEQRVALGRLAGRAGKPVPSLPVPPGGMRAAFERASAPLVPFAAVDRAASAAAFKAEHPGETARVMARAEEILAGRVELFSRTFAFGPDPRRWPWNRDPAGEHDAPATFGPTLDYRDPSRVGDARRAWELGRHGFLAPVAQAAWLSGEERYGRFVFAALEAWIEACPPYVGLQWVSALEYALRSLSWGFALAIVARTEAGRSIEDARWERVLATWAEQLRFVAAHDARHSSANNHRLGEAAGLAWGGIGLGFLDAAPAWRARGLDVLEECLLAQTTPDGVTREHAFQYQQFVLDFAVVVEAAAVRAGRPLPPPVAERLGRVADSLSWFTPGAAVWPVGDGDEGQAFPLGEPFEERAGASLEAAAALTGGPRGVGPRRPRLFWLGLGPEPARAGGAPRSPRSGRVERGGYVVEAWPTPWGEARLLFDRAEMGLPPLYAHGHADALMLLLDVGGRPRLVDPGTGGYHAHAALRERLRTTAAHNTVELGGRPQSAPGGLFQWVRVARVTELDAWSAAHDGYAAAEGVLHRRTVVREGADSIRVVDRIEPAPGRARGAGAACRATVRWHVGDGQARLLEDGSALVRWDDGFECVLGARLPAGGRASVHEDGVWAPRFLEPQPCARVEWTGESPAPFEIETLIRLPGAESPAAAGRREP